ncbi:MAG TPA: alpha-galactosidase [Bryobacteraceae bacterium]|nr:alpha-galactosidase [Bryobacteraceae bacterium]
MAISLRAGCLMFAGGLSLAAQMHTVQYRAGARLWTLGSGSVEYRLRQSAEGIVFDYFGPAGKPAWPPGGAASEISGVVEGQSVSPEALELVKSVPADSELMLRYRHRRLPLEIEAVYGVHGDTIMRRLTLINRGNHVLHVESLPSLTWRLPEGDYDLTYLWGGWGQERQLATEPLSVGRRAFTADRGRSTNGYAAWFALRDRGRGVVYVAQLAWSGNWHMSFDRPPAAGSQKANQAPLAVEMGMRFDFGGALALPPGASFALPEAAFTASDGDLDDAANRLHRYQRQNVIPHRPAGDPLLVQFNSWYPLAEKVPLQELKHSADVAAELGVEAFVLDSGWYVKQDWSRELGDYQANAAKFPNGLQELSRYVRAKGMQFGLWVEIENAGIDSGLARAHPDWFLAYNGTPILKDQRHQLNFAKPDVRQWASATVDRLIRDYGLGWIKIDYNIDIGERFDPPGDTRTGDVLYRHVQAYYAWLDELRAAHPGLLVENCASGGLRFDLGILRHSHTTWLSDMVTPRESAQLAYGCTIEFAPEVCNHWMVGDDDHGHVDQAKPPGWWDFLFRIPMNAQFGISSRVFEWSPELRARAAANVAMYKRLREVIEGADVYHLTAQPAHNDPEGWMAMQYVSPDARRSVVLAYRLGNIQPREIFKLRGLGAGTYHVSQDGRPIGAYTAKELSGTGLALQLDAEWRAAVVELTSASGPEKMK